ncbi:THO complex subunit 6 [Balamuthia mandrillaris]
MESSTAAEEASFSSAYRERLLKRQRERETTVFASAFSPDGHFLVCGNAYGKICVWLLDRCLSEGYWQSVLGKSKSRNHCPPPTYSFQAHHYSSSIYSLCFSGHGQLLISGAEQEIRAWDWNAIAQKCWDIVKRAKEVAESMAMGEGAATKGGFHQQSFATQQTNLGMVEDYVSTNLLLFQLTNKTRTETNGMATDNRMETLYTATGEKDAYAYDLSTQKQISRMQGHSDYLHCIVARQQESQVLTGSEDGTVRIWDTRTMESTAMLDPVALQAVTTDTSSLPKAKSNCWVSCMALDPSDNWMVCGGGTRYLSLWHLSSLTATAVMPSAGAPQAVLFHEDKILSAGNEDKLYLWHKSNGKFLNRITTSSSSIFSLSANKDPVNLAILTAAGNTPLVDVFTEPTHKSFSLKFK